MKKGDTKRGFTMIETVLVLAVAGLIFLAVFIALPTLQRQSRDTQRREDMFKLISAIKKYQQNNRGALPSNWAEELKPYLPENFVDPSGSGYDFEFINCGRNLANGANCTGTYNGGISVNAIDSQAFPNGYKVVVVEEGTCDGLPVKKSNNSRRVAVVYRLEGGGAYCGTT